MKFDSPLKRHTLSDNSLPFNFQDMTPMTSARFSMRLDNELKTWLEDEGKRRDRSAAYVAKQAIAQVKQQAEAKRQMIRDAVAEADKGVFVSQQAVHAWMESWDTDDELPKPQPDIFPNQS